MIRSQKQRVIRGREIQDLTDFVNNLTLGRTFYIKGNKDLRILDTRNASLDEVANVLATLINELQSKGVIPND